MARNSAERLNFQNDVLETNYSYLHEYNNSPTPYLQEYNNSPTPRVTYEEADV